MIINLAKKKSLSNFCVGCLKEADTKELIHDGFYHDFFQNLPPYGYCKDGSHMNTSNIDFLRNTKAGREHLIKLSKLTGYKLKDVK